MSHHYMKARINTVQTNVARGSSVASGSLKASSAPVSGSNNARGSSVASASLRCLYAVRVFVYESQGARTTRMPQWERTGVGKGGDSPPGRGMRRNEKKQTVTTRARPQQGRKECYEV